MILCKQYKSQDTVTVIKIQRLEWLGHVIRMNETRSVKKILEGKLEGRRGRGRPRLKVDKRCGRRFTEAWGKTMENESTE
jgi:hypothetical protein